MLPAKDLETFLNIQNSQYGSARQEPRCECTQDLIVVFGTILSVGITYLAFFVFG